MSDSVYKRSFKVQTVLQKQQENSEKQQSTNAQTSETIRYDLVLVLEWCVTAFYGMLCGSWASPWSQEDFRCHCFYPIFPSGI